MIRRLKADVLSQLPPKNRTSVVVSASGECVPELKQKMAQLNSYSRQTSMSTSAMEALTNSKRALMAV